MKNTKTFEQSPTSREIVITRVLDAPRALVWEVWTKPEHIAQWWGPNGFTTTIEEFDLRPGGRFKQTMHGPDGTDYPNLSVFREIVPLERIVYSHGGGRKGGIGVHFEATWTFESVGENKTRVTGRSIFETPEMRERVAREFGAIEGGKQHLGRLAQHLARVGSGDEEIVIVRDFAAPRALVYDAWTKEEHLKHWWGPKGFPVFFAKLDLRVGGTYLFGMRTPNGGEMWGKFVFREIKTPERLVWVHSFSDPQGGTVRHPGHAAWPLEMLNSVTFVENNGGTTVTLRSRALNATESERKVFRAEHDGMRGGYGGTFDQLEEYLARA
jgi:uncharacterized protein YndB with AHSA1/START domain